MFKPRLYLDTSVISALFDERTPERKAMTEAAWARLPEYDVNISSIVLEELNEVTEPLGEAMRIAIADFTVLQITSSIENLAQRYIDHGIFPDKYYADALHVAIASMHQINYLLSWNFKHLVKVKTRRLVALTNTSLDLFAVEIIAPLSYDER